MVPHTDHALYAAMVLLACLLASAFGLLHIIAAAVQLSRDHRPMNIVMLIGGALALAAAPACLFGWPGNMDALLMAIGGGAVCGAAFYNGRSGGNFHLVHHLVRFGAVLLLVFVFIGV